MKKLKLTSREDLEERICGDTEQAWEVKDFRLRHRWNCMMRHVDDKGWFVAKPETKKDKTHSSNHVVFLGIRSFYPLWYFIKQFGGSRGSLIRSTWNFEGFTYIRKMCEEWSKISWSSYMSANIKNNKQKQNPNPSINVHIFKDWLLLKERAYWNAQSWYNQTHFITQLICYIFPFFKLFQVIKFHWK